MKKSILLGCLMIISLTAFAQETAKSQEVLPSHSIFLTAGHNFNGGIEVSIGSEYFFNTNHTVSLYGLVNYHNSMEDWWGESLECKKAMAEIGGRYYIPAVRNKFYPYVGLGLTAGIQNIRQITHYQMDNIVNNDKDPYLFGGVGTIGLEYLLSKNVAIEIVGRIKYTGHTPNYTLGGGLKFCF